MYLPTINYVNLSFIHNFPLSSLTPSVNLLQLDISYVDPLLEGGSYEFVVQLEMMPKIRNAIFQGRPADDEVVTNKFLSLV